jgi:hypothetical protein
MLIPTADLLTCISNDAFVQNNNNARSGFTSAKKRSGMVSNLLNRWRNDFATVKRQRDGFGAFRKETGCHPASFKALYTFIYMQANIKCKYRNL